ncbi:MAG: beta-propeller domain-containing protein [Polyangiales bacterium]
MALHQRLLLAALFVAPLIGCSTHSCDDVASAAPAQAGGATETPSPPSSAQRAIAEADIVQLDGGRLYAMSKSGRVSIVDVSHPENLALLGSTTLPGTPFEMYLHGGMLIALSNGAIRADGSRMLPSIDTTAAAADAGSGALVIVLDVREPQSIASLTTLAVPGEVADSRIVGDAMYLATYENASCFDCGTKPRTMVTSFDVSDVARIKRIDQASFESTAPDSFNLPWGLAWKRSLLATTTRLYVGGHADIDPSSFDKGEPEGIIDVLDVSDPTGHLGKGARIRVAGAVLSRWQMDEVDGVFRVVSQPGAGRTGNGTGMPQVATFSIESTNAFHPLGQTSITLPRQEGLRTVRFDGNRAYAITFNQTDPLFIIDLADPAKPATRGQLEMPGWMFHLEPRGDRLLGLGVDRTDAAGGLNVSLFDVSDPDAPKMVRRVSFGAKTLGEDFEILNYELPEDQDRIQKAFRIFADGLITVPFSSTNAYDGTDACNNPASGIQLVEWSHDDLIKRALLPMAGNPRRAFELESTMIAVSDSNVRSFSLANRDVATPKSDLVIGTCAAKSLPAGSGWGGGNYGGDYGGWNGGGCE